MENPEFASDQARMHNFLGSELDLDLRVSLTKGYLVKNHWLYSMSFVLSYMLMHPGIYSETLWEKKKKRRRHEGIPMAEQYPFSMNRGNCSVTLWGLAHLNMCVVPVSSLIRTDWVMAKTQQGWFNKMKCICSGPLNRNTHSTNYACQLVCISEFSKKKKKKETCEVWILYNRNRQLKWIYERSVETLKIYFMQLLSKLLPHVLQVLHLHLLLIPDLSSSSSCSSSSVYLNFPLYCEVQLFTGSSGSASLLQAHERTLVIYREGSVRCQAKI